MGVTKEEFKRAMGCFASGVTVVTTVDAESKARGITVSAFASLSLEPPLVLICIDKNASVHDHLTEGRHFAVNILAENQENVSRRFASSEPDRFGGVSYRSGSTGSPLLDGVVAFVECRVTNSYPGGDHTIVVGHVLAAGVNDDRALAYFRGRYTNLR